MKVKQTKKYKTLPHDFGRALLKKTDYLV